MGNLLGKLTLVHHPDEHIGIIVSLMLKDMISFLLPYARRIFQRKTTGPSASIKWLQQRQFVAAHVKSAFEKVKVYVINDEELCNRLVDQQMLQPGRPVHFIGLDCEWESRKKDGIALLQISSGNDCILYRTCQTQGHIPQNLKKLLEDRKVLKFGVGIEEDVRRLRLHGVQVKGFVDLRNLAHRCAPGVSGGKPDFDNPEEELYQWNSLSALSLNTLEMQLSKNYTVRCGNWEAQSLSRKQIMYAAKDAIVSLEIFYALVLLRRVRRRQGRDVLDGMFESSVDFHKMLQGFQESSSSCFYYSHSKDTLNDVDAILPTDTLRTSPSQSLTELSYSLCQGIVDIKHKPKLVMNHNVQKTASRAYSTTKQTTTQLDKTSKRYNHQCRDRPLYENCFLIGPDKQILATVNRTKAEWYLHKNIGVVEKDEPFTVRLLFEPSGKPKPDADYYTTVKENVCTVCGSTENFVKKNIIPHDYRKYFPQQMKDHMSHDVLLFCIDCHRTAQYFDDQVRQDLATKYKAPLGTKQNMFKTDNPQLGRVRSAAKALLKNSANIPTARREELEAIILNHFKVDSVNIQLLKDTMAMDIRVENNKFLGLHGERVVKGLLEENGLIEFIKMWRQRYLDTMKPKFLPPLWSVDHNLQKFNASN